MLAVDFQLRTSVEVVFLHVSRWKSRMRKYKIWWPVLSISISRICRQIYLEAL